MKSRFLTMGLFGAMTVLLAFSVVQGQTGYNAFLRIGVVDTAYNQNEWAVYVYVDVFDQNSNLVSPYPDANYTWYRDYCDGGGMQQTYGAGYYQKWDGLKHENIYYCESGISYSAYEIQARVQIPGGPAITTPSLMLPDEGVKVQSLAQLLNRNVTLDQKLADGSTSYASVGLWIAGETFEFMNYPAPTAIAFRSGYSETFRGNQSLYQGASTQKYNDFARNQTTQSDVVNPKSFTIASGDNSFTSNFNTVYNATVQSQVVDASVSSASLDFMDPWLIDYNDPTYGMRNQGMSASYYTIAYAQNNVGINSNNKGIFIGQSGPPQWSSPYYRVRAQGVRMINGYTAFFSGWSTSNTNLRDDGLSGDGYYYADVEFVSSGATVTAQYKYYTITHNTTLPSGTWSMAGTVTVPSGVTLTTSSSASLQFPSGGGLTVNGVLNASGTTFTQSSSGWTGITLNANGSSLTNSCVISYASAPLTLNGVTNTTISTCTINNSTFSSTQAILVNGGSPTITNTTINGISGSSNGVRFQNSSAGSMSDCDVNGCASGNGVVVQGNSSPSIIGCQINNNHYYGVIVNSDGTGLPSIQGSNISANGGTSYTNLEFLSLSTAVVVGNYLQNGFAGIGAYGGSWPYSSWAQQAGGNVITGNTYGVLCADAGSEVYLGKYDGRFYLGICNEIHDNTSLDVNVWGGGTLMAIKDWWGVSPPNTSKWYGLSSIYYTPYMTSPSDCPYSQDELVLNPGQLISGMSSLTSTNPDSLLQIAGLSLIARDYATATSACRKVLGSGASTAQKQGALVRILNTYLMSNDSTILSDLNSFMRTSADLGETAEELLVTAYATTKQIPTALSLANDLIARYSGTDVEKRALLLVASFSAFDPSFTETSAAAVTSLRARFASSLDEGLLAALSTTPIVGTSMSKSMKGNMETDAVAPTPENYELENYPNPFNPTTVIRYALPKDTRVTIKVYDMIGQMVATLVDGDETQGYHEVSFDGSRYASGVYLYRLTAPGVTITKKMLMTK